MRSWIGASRLATILLALTALGTPFARAQVRPATNVPVATADVEQILRLGRELEQQRRWGEALTHYEEALRKNPGLQDISQRLSVARLHYEVARRYADSSYVDAIAQLSSHKALEVYSEVLLKIHAYHVDQPLWKDLFDRGTMALEIAASEPAFQRKYHYDQFPERLTHEVDSVSRSLANQAVRSRQESRDAVAYVAKRVETQTGIPQQSVILEYACAAVASLDDYSAFLTSSQLDEIMSQIEGSFVGLGVELKGESQSLLIVNVISGGPADRAGLKPGDRIVQVQGRSTAEVSSDVAADMLKGPEGSSVDLVVMSPQGTTRSMRIRRQTVEVPSIEGASIVDAQYGIAYMKLPSFQKTTGRDVETALWKLHREGMRSLIVDLRGNPGGLLTAAVEVADKFISEGTIVETRGRGTGENFDYKAHLAGTWRMPLVVLIDGDSASASEIFAAAVRDSQRGTVVGQRSFGKGSVQGIFPLTSSAGGLRITTAKFYSPTHQPISGHGVEPHVLVHATARPVLDGRLPESSDGAADPFLTAALQIARQQLASR